jgi:hypothetical protein
MTLVWTRGNNTRENMNHVTETFLTYTTDRYPGYRIERWDAGTYGVFDDKDKFCSTRDRLADAKTLLVWLATDADPCQYSAAHAASGIQASTEIDCGAVGMVRACQRCADFYGRMSG